MPPRTSSASSRLTPQRPAAAPGGGHLPAAGPHPAGPGRRRHEDLPVPRPGPAPARTPPSCGTPDSGLGTVTHQNIGYLLPMGPVLLVLRRHRRARLGGPAALAGQPSCSPPARASSTSCAPSAGPTDRRATTTRRPPATWRDAGMSWPPRLHAEPLRAGLLGPHLGDPAAVGRPALAHRLHRPGHPRSAAGATRPCSPWCADRRRHQRHRARPGRARPAALGRLRRVGRPRGHRAARRSAPSGRIGAARPWAVALVVRRPVGQGRYGLPIIRYTETLPGRRRRLQRARGPPGPRLLVLLRQRQARPVDRARASTTRSCGDPPLSLRPADPRLRRRAALAALALPGATSSPSSWSAA